MKIRQLSVFLENKPGQLGALCQALAEAKVSIITLSLADTSDFGIVRMIVDDHEKAQKVLTEAGHLVKVNPVFAVTVPDRPGGMAEIVTLLSDHDCSIEYSYAFSFHHGEKAVLVFRFGDNAKAEKVLSAAGYTTLTESQIEDQAK